MTEMIAAEPALAERVLARLAPTRGPATLMAQLINRTASASRRIVVTGCGTSEHGALGFVEIVRDALVAIGIPNWTISSEQAFEVALDPPPDALVIGISHEGATWATNRALEAARTAGARTAVVTASDRSPAASIADIVVTTEEIDQSWCHTIGYLSPLLAGVAVGAALRGEDARRSIPAIRSLLTATAEQESSIEAAADALAETHRILVVGSGADRTAGRELTLKIEEGTWIPAAYRDLETFLHGHFPAADASTGLVLIAADRRQADARLARGRQMLAAMLEIGVHSAAITTGDGAAAFTPDLTPAGRVRVNEAAGLPTPVAALLGTTVPLQLLTERIARARGTNPDPIRRDDPRHAAAASRIED
jgi:fructoselysine-6-P-deglycase FrlB-like protein